jgi:hypothetical protein
MAAKFLAAHFLLSERPDVKFCGIVNSLDAVRQLGDR